MNRPYLLPLLGFTLLLSACGGGGGSETNQPPPGGTTQKSASVAFSVFSTAALPGAIQGVSLHAILPAGVTVPTDPGSNVISSSAMVVNGSLTGPLVFGTYSAGARKVKVSVVTTAESFRSGEVVRLAVTYPSTAQLSLSDFTAPNEPTFPYFMSAGYDVTTHSTIDLTAKVKPSIGVTFN